MQKVKQQVDVRVNGKEEYSMEWEMNSRTIVILNFFGNPMKYWDLFQIYSLNFENAKLRDELDVHKFKFK